MKSLLNPTRSFFSGQLLSHFAWLATAGALFPAAACSDAGLDVGNDSRGVNSHEDGATDDSSDESADDDDNDNPMETPAPDVSVEGDDETMAEPGNPDANPNPMEITSPTPLPMTSSAPAPTFNPMESPEVPGNMVPSPQPAPLPPGPDAMCPAGLTLCAGECVDVSSDLLNCGACGFACMASAEEMNASCQQGVCTAWSPIGPPYCGDGFLDMASESCDDGNAVGGDGCSAMCTAEEDAFDCPNPEQPCMSVCGNGVIEQEACDDGNEEPGDGCDSTCTVELGFVCTVEESTPSMSPDAGAARNLFSQCDPICGDGIVAGDEECDSGGMTPDEACTTDCTLPI